MMMVDIGSIAALVGSLKAAGDITKTVMGLRDGQMIQAKIIELQSVILSAQSSALTAQQDQFTMLEKVRALEQQVAQLERWNGEAEQHELKQIDGGAFAYMHKSSADGSAPPHWLCVNCFEHKRKSILQYKERTKDNRSSVWACPHCKSQVVTHWSRKPGDSFLKPSDAG
jgi:hypothetical protein